MLSDKFFEEYAKTGESPKVQGETPEPETKETYTRAEVDEIISKTIAETLENMRGEPVKVAPVEQETETEKETETDTE